MFKMTRKTVICFMILCLMPLITPAEGEVKKHPSPFPKRDFAREQLLHEKDSLAENMPALELAETVSRSFYNSLGATRETSTVDIPLSEWTSNTTPDFEEPRFSRNTLGQLEMRPNLSVPHNTYGFWSSPEFTVLKPDQYNNDNSVTIYVEFSYTGVPLGYRMPSLRARYNRSDFLDAGLYLYDGENMDPNGGTGEITCKLDTNLLTQDASYFVSVDFIAFDAPIDPDFTLTITKVYLMGVYKTAPPDFIIDGVWVETDEDAKAWINGYKVTLLSWCYDAAYNDRMAAMIYIYNESRNQYDVYVWSDDVLTWLNADDTYQVAVAGNYVAYLEQDGDVKVWNPATDELTRIKTDGFRISSGGDEALMIWDLDNDLYIWLPQEGLYKVDEDDIWFLCDTSSVPVALY